MQKMVFIIVLSLFCMKSITAQSKIGAVNTNTVFNKMVEAENLNDILKRYQDSLSAVAIEKEKILNEQILRSYCHDCPPLPDSIKKKKRQELIEEVKGISNFYEQVQSLCAKRSEELITPLKKRLKDVVRQIAAENNYYYVLDMSDEHLSFLPLPPYDNVTELVLVRLNL